MTFEVIETECNYQIMYKNEIVLTLWFKNKIEELEDHEIRSFYHKEVAKEVVHILCELFNDDNSKIYEEVQE